jgi:3-oxoacyl-[acyl-carrier protein] reductase
MNSAKSVLVTGATRGLGLAITERLKSDGYTIVATGRKNSQTLQAVISNDSPGRVLFYEFDLLNNSKIREFVKQITSEVGALYGLVNYAAIGHDGILATMHKSKIEELLNVNILSPILLTKYVSRSMLLHGTGRIVNVSSIIASTGFTGLSVYGASKSALIGFTRSLARELGKANITVNAVLPGFMDTDMTKTLNRAKLETIKRRSPLGRLTSVTDVANMVSFLMGSESQSITGTTISVDAGTTA